MKSINSIQFKNKILLEILLENLNLRKKKRRSKATYVILKLTTKIS